MHPATLIGLALAFAAAPPRPYDPRPFVERHCVACHGPKLAEGGLRLDRLPADFDDPHARERWLAVRERLDAGDMPPEGRPRPPKGDVASLSAWAHSQARAAVARRAAEGRVVLRRLNRDEYQNTVRDLLGVVVDLKDLLPEDGSAHGFDNVGEALHVSSFLMDRYLEAAQKALDLAIANGPQPPVVKRRLSLKDTHHVKTTTESVFRVADDGTVVCFSSSAWNAVTLTGFYPPHRGTYRFRISARAVQNGERPVSFRVDGGPMLMATKSHLIDYFEAPAGGPKVFEFVDHLEARSTIRLHPHGLAGAQAVNKVGAKQYEGPGLAVNWVEVEGPLHESWPPPSHKRLFGELPREPAPAPDQRDRVEVASDDERADAERILRSFARRAFRREVSDADVAPFVKLFESRREAKLSFERSVRVGLLAVMVSPDFLFLREKPGRLGGFALASRLSYFLWRTTPDEELMGLAKAGRLGDEAVLREQVERLLKGPKSKAFVEDFVDQWLGLREIDFTIPSHLLYPEYDELLKASMLSEARLFFEEVLRRDLSLTNFVASDFTMANERLAKHYGLAGVRGHAFRRVALPRGSRRGGVMTMAGVLKVTANGTTTSPVTRGAWVLDRLLGQPPAPPPADVPALEPDVRGAVTVRQQLARHRADAACATCHVKIDPPGFALESYDVIGGWRDHYRTLGNGKPVAVDGRRMPYRDGAMVEPADTFEGEKFADVDGFKALLLKDEGRLARALAVRLLTFATGGSPLALSRRDVDAVVASARQRGYGLRSLVHAVTRSEAFQSK